MKWRHAFAPWSVGVLAAFVLSGLFWPEGPVWAEGLEDHPGAPIYRQHCASCHGAKGEGSQEYPHPLVGDRSVLQLARFIEKTMPEDDPDLCRGADAERVASYIYEAFYSRTAQARNQPPRIELARLTVRQHQQTLADLVGSFREPARRSDERGLRGEYFKSRRMWRDGERLIERIDPQVNFDFGEAAPGSEGFDAERFSARWRGTVWAPDTGDYEFVVQTEHAARLWINDPARPLIDAWVKSGNDTEYRASIRLLGGRDYLLRLEFAKGRLGDPDQKKEETPKPVPASIRLLWKPPHGTLEVIPARNLTPGQAPEWFVVQAPFPPDDRSVGYERGTSVSKAWYQAVTEAAIETANHVVEHLEELSKVKDDAPDRAAALQEFCRRFAERAFRRPLDESLTKAAVERPFEEVKDLETAVKRSVLYVLKSPRFLFHDLEGTLDAYGVASRISYALWDSLPDQELLQAAAAHALSTEPQIAEQAERMLADPRARVKLREFLLQWLRVDRATELAKDPSRFPDFDEAVAADLRVSLELFLDEVVSSESSDFRRLLLEDQVYLNGRLARFYGADLPSDADFQKVRLEPEVRSGLLTHPLLLSAFAYSATSSPIHRGVFISRGILGRTLRPPPEAVAPLAPDLHPDLTTRERVVVQTSPKSCQMCHGMINNLGFALENFDAVGRYRTLDNGKPVDPSGSYQSKSGEQVSFTGARDLAVYLAASEEAQASFVLQLFHHLVKQPINAFGSHKLSDLRAAFAANAFNIRKLIVEIVAELALTPRESAAATSVAAGS